MKLSMRLILAALLLFMIFIATGTPVDCISLGLSGALFAWSKPILVISGINQGSSCGHQMFYSGAVAGAREALISGVPSLSFISSQREASGQKEVTPTEASTIKPCPNSSEQGSLQRSVKRETSVKNLSASTNATTNLIQNNYAIKRQTLDDGKSGQMRQIAGIS